MLDKLEPRWTEEQKEEFFEAMREYIAGHYCRLDFEILLPWQDQIKKIVTERIPNERP